MNYDQDFYAWTLNQAKALREGKLSDLDAEHIAEELETMGRTERRELISRLTVLIAHLLKWQYQPEHRSRSWRLTIAEQRRQIRAILEDSPSLRTTLEDAAAQAYRDGAKLALYETGLIDSPFPTDCPYDLEEILSEDDLP